MIMIKLKDLRHIISPKKAVIKRQLRKIDKTRKKKTKSKLPCGVYGRIKILTPNDTYDK